MTVWHGTLDQFDQFSEGDIGFHFSRDRRVALNRISDKIDDHACTSTITTPMPQPVLVKAEINVQHPLVLNSDLGDWTALGILTSASLVLLKKPFESPSSIPPSQQRKMSKAAMSILRTLKIDNETACRMLSQIQLQSSLNAEFTHLFRIRLQSESTYDAITYPNEHESEDGIDPVCIIIPDSDAITILERIPISLGDL